jgi:hypothetical protein
VADHDRLIQRPVWVPDRIDNVVPSDSGHIPVWDAPDALVKILLATAGHDDALPSSSAQKRWRSAAPSTRAYAAWPAALGCSDPVLGFTRCRER